MDPVIIGMREVVRSGRLSEFKDSLAAEGKLEALSPYLTIAEKQLSHLKFIQHCWVRARSVEVGLHTWLICRKIDQAFERFRNGISTNLMTLIPFRHGKSEITTRYLPAHFLAEFPDRNSIVTSHSTKKTAEFSRFGRLLVRSEKFKELYPHIEISKENAGVEEWGIENHEAISQYYGILSGSAGTGGALVVTDDYFGGREDAESSLMRDKIHEAYTDNIFTRRDDPAISLITVTPWHADDLVGRLLEKQKTDKDSTQYEVIRLPYKEPDDETIEMLENELKSELDQELKDSLTKELEVYANGGYLFSKKYSDQWYLDMETSLGGPSGYGTTSLMRCSPRLKGGNRLKTENIKVLKQEEFTEKTIGLTFVRAWDLASTSKNLMKKDPDYTAGVNMAVKTIPTSIPGVMSYEIYIKDVIRGRMESPRRNKLIQETAISDGLIRVGVESFGAYKDAYNELKEVLRGIRVVRKMTLSGDKISKASCLEPIFDSGNVYILKAPWNETYVKELGEFPSGSHDDQVDATVIGFRMFSPVKTGFRYNEQLVV